MNATTTTTPEIAAIVPTPGHTIGPFFHDALRWAEAPATARAPGSGVVIEGSVEDGSGELLPAWLIEAWVPHAVQTESDSPAPGFRRLMNDTSGHFQLCVPLPPPGQPAAYVTLFGLGLTRHMNTAVFLEPPPAPEGTLLGAVPAERRTTLVATRVGEGRYRWTIRTQGEQETVFLEYR